MQGDGSLEIKGRKNFICGKISFSFMSFLDTIHEPENLLPEMDIFTVDT